MERACANVSKKCSYIYKEDATSPTAATESVLITATIDAHKRRNGAVFNIPGAYDHTETSWYLKGYWLNL